MGQENSVCDYCGKAKGWHVWFCPGLKWPAQVFWHGEKPVVEEVVVIATLPEVE